MVARRRLAEDPPPPAATPAVQPRVSRGASPVLLLREALGARLLPAETRRSPRASMLFVLTACGLFWAAAIALVLLIT